MPPGAPAIAETREARLSKLKLARSRSQANPALGAASSLAPGLHSLGPPGAVVSTHAAAIQGSSAHDRWSESHTAVAAAAVPSCGGGAGSDATREEALAQAARLEGANRRLREGLQDALQELDEAHSQLHILQSLQQQFEDGTPGAAELVAAAVDREHVVQAARDAQVLQLLRAKDEVIGSFEARYAESRAEVAQYREQLDAAQQQLEASQLRVRELVEAKCRQHQQAEEAAAVGAEARAALRAEVVRLQAEAAPLQPFQQRVALLEEQLAAAGGELSGAQRQLQTLSDTVDAANDAIVEMQTLLAERERDVADKAAELQAMQQHLAQLLGMPDQEAATLHRTRFCGTGPGADQAASCRIAALEAVNEWLEMALVEATRRAAAGAAATNPLAAISSSGDSEGDAVGELSARLAVATGRLQAAEEQVDQLEKLLKVAEATVLHNEMQMQESLEGRMQAEEQLHRLRLELEDSQALLTKVKAVLGQLAASEKAALEQAAAVCNGVQAAVAELVQNVEAPEAGQSGVLRQLKQAQGVPEEQQGGSSEWQDSADVGDIPCPAVPSSQLPVGATEDALVAVGTLIQRIRALEHQVTQQQAAATVAAQQRTAAAPAVQSAGVQCELLAQCSAAAQTGPEDAAVDAISQAAGVQNGDAPAAGYGQPDPLQQQVEQLTANLAAQQRTAAAPAVQSAGVQCELLAQCSAAAQTGPEDAAMDAISQPSGVQNGDAPAAGYGQPDPLQQQVAQLTADLAAARLAEVGTKAELVAANSALLEMEHKLKQQKVQCTACGQLAGAAEVPPGTVHAADCTCPAAVRLQAECSNMQGEVARLDSCVLAARQEGEAQLAQAAAVAQMRHQALQKELVALEQGQTELRELRSSAYAAVHRMWCALREHGMGPSARPDGVEEGSMPQQLKHAVDGLVALLQERADLVTAFQQHVLHQQQMQPLDSSARSGMAAGANGGGVSLEASQRAVIRSLAGQVADMQQCLEHAAAGTSTPAVMGPAAGRAGLEQPPPAAVPGMPGDVAQLVGMFALLKQQLAGLERVQQRLETACGSGNIHGGSGIAAPHLSEASHAAAMLSAELPSLQATARVMESEVRHISLQATVAAMPESAGAFLFLPAVPGANSPAAAPRDTAQRKEKWKARCKDMQAQLVAVQQAEVAAGAKLAATERASAEQVAQQAGVVQVLQARVEELVVAGTQLESALRDMAQQLADAAHTAEGLQAQLEQQRQGHQADMVQAGSRLAASQATLEQERRQHADLVARLQEMGASLQNNGDAEQRLRCQLMELAERVAVLTTAQEASKAEAEHKQRALADLEQELVAAHAATAALQAASQQREAALVGRLEAMQQECGALMEVASQGEEQHAEVEKRLQARLRLLGSRLNQLGHDATAQLPGLTASLSKLHSSAETMEGRLLWLEAQVAVALQDRSTAAVSQWTTLLRSRRYRSAVKQLRDGLQAQLLDAQAVCQQQATQLRQLQVALEAARDESSELSSRLEATLMQNQHELQAAEQQWQQALVSLRQEVQEEQQEAQRTAEEARMAAVAEVEQRCKVQMAARALQLEQRALLDLEAAEQQCGVTQGEMEALRDEFRRYQATKAVEVRLLEQRVLQQLHNSSSTTNSIGKRGSKPAPASEQQQPVSSSGIAVITVEELGAASRQEGIAAALREARLERLHREQVEGELSAAKLSVEQLGARARAAEQELLTNRGRQAGECKMLRERAERLATELADCQQALRLAKAEGGRRLKELQALQRQAAATDENGGANGAAAAAQLETEQHARAAAEAQLREARQALARKTTLIKDLRAKIDGLEQQVAAMDPAPLLAELEACQARLQHSQAACGSKDVTVRELRQRLDQQTRLAHQQGVLEEQEKQEAALARLQRKLVDREAQVAHLHQRLQQVHQQLETASAGLQAAAANRTAEADDAATQLAGAQRCALQLLQAVHQLLDAMAQLCCAAAAAEAAAAAAAADRQGAWPGSSQAATIAAAAGDIAQLVDLAPDDIRSVLLPGPDVQRGAAATAAIAPAMDATIQQAAAALQRLEAEMGTADWQASQATVSALLDALAALGDHCARARASLAEWQASGAPTELSAISTTAFVDLEQRLQEAAAEVAALEARIG